jgi:hypothetical protein
MLGGCPIADNPFSPDPSGVETAGCWCKAGLINIGRGFVRISVFKAG